MMDSLARGSGRALVALVCIGLGAGACEISSSSTDRKARIEEQQAIEEENRLIAAYERRQLLMWQTFKARYKDRIVPGEGCDVCAGLCEHADLRAMETSAFQQAYRRVVYELNHFATDPAVVLTLATMEHDRLRCIALRTPEMRTALVQLLDAREIPNVRYKAAVDALELGFDTREPRQALYELSQGSGLESHSGQSRGLLESWDDEHWRETAERERWLMMQPRQ